MPYILAGIAYMPIPKVACTSIKQMLYMAEHGRRFEPYKGKNGKTMFIHDAYPAIPFDKIDHALIADCDRIAVVRDPVLRVLSAYSNRVVFHRELSAEKQGEILKKLDLAPDPDLATFVDRLDEYAAAFSGIHHHTRPQVDFLGYDPTYLSKIYRFSELEMLAEDVRRRTGTEVQLPWLQKGGPKIPISALSRAQQDKLHDMFADDYVAFGHWFTASGRRKARPPVTSHGDATLPSLGNETQDPIHLAPLALQEKVRSLEAALADAKAERDEWRDQAKRLAMALPTPDSVEQKMPGQKQGF